MQVTTVHYDLTDLCNAGCPQCARTNVDGCKPNDWLMKRTMSLDDFKRYSPESFLEKLNYVFFCGNFGDPLTAPDLIPILEYCWTANPKLKIHVHSNCSLRTPDWWAALAETARDRDFRVIASVDGASQQTNSLYRVGTSFSRIMSNLETFIAGGGRAEWRMIVFRHNEHEVARAREMADERGFVGFKSYPSNRFGGAKSFEYRYKTETFYLEPPTGAYEPKSKTRMTIAPQKVLQTRAVIRCDALRQSDIFIDFLGNLAPCCYVGGYLYKHAASMPFEARYQDLRVIFDAFDVSRLNVNRSGFDDAFAALGEFFDYLSLHWPQQEPYVCKRVCGKKEPTVAPDVDPAATTTEAGAGGVV